MSDPSPTTRVTARPMAVARSGATSAPRLRRRVARPQMTLATTGTAHPHPPQPRVVTASPATIDIVVPIARPTPACSTTGIGPLLTERQTMPPAIPWRATTTVRRSDCTGSTPVTTR